MDADVKACFMQGFFGTLAVFGVVGSLGQILMKVLGIIGITGIFVKTDPVQDCF